MANSKDTTVTSTPKYISPETSPEGGICCDRSLSNYSNTSKAIPLKRTSSRLYDTIAFAYDNHPRPTGEDTSSSFSRVWHERRRSSAKLVGNSADYLGLSPDFPGWRSRRSSHETRRGAIPVAPSEVNSLLPYIPPMYTSSSPPSQEWLDEKARQILAAAHAEIETGDHLYAAERSNTGVETLSTMGSKSQNYLNLHFDYDCSSSLNSRTAISRTPHQQCLPQPLRAESASAETDRNIDGDTDTDTDIDEEGDDGYNWSTTRICEASPLALADVPRWIIPRKRPSVVSVNGDSPMDNDSEDDSSDSDDDDDDLPFNYNPRSSPSPGPTERSTPPLSSDDESTGKRQRRGSLTPSRAVKKLKRHSADTPTRLDHRSDESADPYQSLDSEEDTSSSERALSRSPPANISPIRNSPRPPSPPPLAVLSSSIQPIPPQPRMEPCRITPRSRTPVRSRPAPKSYPCRLDGCTQICASAGDLQRHQQSLRHRTPSCVCLACGKIYTRPDALKRHLNAKAACKREHASKLAQVAEDQVVEAEDSEA